MDTRKQVGEIVVDHGAVIGLLEKLIVMHNMAEQLNFKNENHCKLFFETGRAWGFTEDEVRSLATVHTNGRLAKHIEKHRKAVRDE